MKCGRAEILGFASGFQKGRDYVGWNRFHLVPRGIEWEWDQHLWDFRLGIRIWDMIRKMIPSHGIPNFPKTLKKNCSSQSISKKIYVPQN